VRAGYSRVVATSSPWTRMMVTAGGGGEAAFVAALPRLAATRPRRTIAAATAAVVHPVRLMMFVMNIFMMAIMYNVKWIPKGVER